jgi:hypothetical protein
MSQCRIVTLNEKRDAYKKKSKVGKVAVISWNVIHYSLKKLWFRSITNNNERGHNPTLCYEKCWPTFLSEATFNKTIFWLIIFSFLILLHKIIALIFNMFIYAKVGHSKLIEMHRNASDFYRSALVFHTWVQSWHRVNITIYWTVYLHTDMCKR